MDKIRECYPDGDKCIGCNGPCAPFKFCGKMDTRAALSSPVADDARELEDRLLALLEMGDDDGKYWACFRPGAAAIIERYAAERERKEREEEREACAERAVAWQRKLCEDDDWPCLTCTECDQLRAAIKEAPDA